MNGMTFCLLKFFTQKNKFYVTEKKYFRPSETKG
jgi:hypothetical protein